MQTNKRVNKISDVPTLLFTKHLVRFLAVQPAFGDLIAMCGTCSAFALCMNRHTARYYHFGVRCLLGTNCN